MHLTDDHAPEILIVGAGSVGRRHLRNLEALGWRRVRFCRSGRSTLPDADLADYPADRDLETALARQPIAVIVANPTAYHMPVAMAAAQAGAHLLIEKPIAHELDQVDELERLVAERHLAALVGFQFRFSPGLRQVKQWLESGAIGRVLSAQVHWGEFLPGMHPWEDYRQGYAAREDLGGGVLLTLCHPFDYLRWLLGDVDEVSAVESGAGTLDLTVETCVDATLRFAGGHTAHVHLNFVQQPRDHHLTIVGTHGTINWSDRDHAAHRYCPASGQWETAPLPEGYERNWMFLDEMRHFVASLRGEARSMCSLSDGRAALAITLAAKQALGRTRPVAVGTVAAHHAYR